LKAATAAELTVTRSERMVLADFPQIQKPYTKVDHRRGNKLGLSRAKRSGGSTHPTVPSKSAISLRKLRFAKFLRHISPTHGDVRMDTIPMGAQYTGGANQPRLEREALGRDRAFHSSFEYDLRANVCI